MCLIALFFRCVEDAPLIVGANREEFYARGGELPRLLEGPCRMAAGIDPLAGGTWLGVNEYDVLVAVTNRTKLEAPPQPRSRGLLARELLGYRSAAEAADQAARELGQNRYAGCNLVCADRNVATAVLAGDWLRVRPLPPGIHVLTNRDIDDGSDPRTSYALGWLNDRDFQRSDQCVAALQDLCAQTGNGGPPICLRGKDRGTVSSSIIALRSPRQRSVYLHAQGPPDVTPYLDCSYLLHELATNDLTEG